MIKKNTKIIFDGENNNEIKEISGGMPLSKGEIIHYQNSSEIVDFEVIDKKIEYIVDGEDDIINITYVLKKK